MEATAGYEGRLSKLEERTEHLATKADLYRALLVQTGVILFGVGLMDPRYGVKPLTHLTRKVNRHRQSSP